MTGAIVAMGGGGFSEEPDNPLLDGFVLGLARREHPRVCFLGTASGDADSYVARFYRAFVDHDCYPSDLALFNREVADLRRFVLEQDVIYVGGGNTASLLAVWRAHGLDTILQEALAGGAVLCGVSAGMNCWFEASVTDSFGPALAPLDDGLGFIVGSACPHYDADEPPSSARRPRGRSADAPGRRSTTPTGRLTTASLGSPGARGVGGENPYRRRDCPCPPTRTPTGPRLRAAPV